MLCTIIADKTGTLDVFGDAILHMNRLHKADVRVHSP